MPDFYQLKENELLVADGTMPEIDRVSRNVPPCSSTCTGATRNGMPACMRERIEKHTPVTSAGATDRNIKPWQC